jgi:hypothetical protein
MITQEFLTKLNNYSREKGEQLLRAAAAELKDDKRYNSGELLQSLQLQVIEGTAEKPPVIIVTYAPQGAFMEVKKMEWTRQPNIEKLLAWSKYKRFNLTSIPGYKNGNAPNLSEQKKVERIVWAIAKRQEKYDVWKRKPWKAKPVVEFLRQLNREVLEIWANEAEKTMLEALTGMRVTPQR